jgi:hypothetical protein
MQRSRIAACVAGLIGAMAIVASAAAGPVGGPTPRGFSAEILQALSEVRRQYGNDAVMIEGFLMGQAIENGSVLETAVGVAGVEERAHHKYLTFKLDTGIVYNDHELDADTRLARTWTRIVEPTLRRFKSIDVPADGVSFAVSYTHKPYTDEPDLRTHLKEGHGEPEDAVFYLLTRDVSELMASRISAQQLVDRSIVTANGAARQMKVEPPRPTPAPEAAD